MALAIFGASLATVALTFGGFWAYQAFAVSPPLGSLTLQTTPPGATVTVNGQASGATPLSLTLPAGTYSVRLTTPTGQERSIEVTLKGGDSVVQHVEWAETRAVAGTTGGLHIQTDPPGQAVFVDDIPRGTSPVTIPDLTAGEHRLTVGNSANAYRRQVTITPGNTLSVVVAPQAPIGSGGWLRVASDVPLQFHSGGELIGSTDSARTMLPAGEHDLELSNSALGFSIRRRVTIAPGRTSEVRVPLPNGTVSINAIPWAEVWLNGERVGDTPLANLSRPIGTYRVTLRHPQFGERERSVTVSLKETARLGVDMRQR